MRRFLWTIPLLLGLVFVVTGAYMASEGAQAKNDVRDTLVAESIVTAEDAAIPNEPVDDAETALAQANVINKHVLERTEGKTYSQMDREDPNRDLYLKAVTLRTALTQAYVGFKVADLVTGMGLIIILVGLGNIAVGGALALRR